MNLIGYPNYLLLGLKHAQMLEKKNNGAGVFDFAPFDEIIYLVLAIKDHLPVSQLRSNNFLGFFRQHCHKKTGAALDYPTLGRNSAEINELIGCHRETRFFE